MTTLTQPSVGSSGWGDAVNTNWQIIQDMLNGGLLNPIINGGFDFYQRQTPSTYTNIADNKYGPDRWRITRQSANLATAQLSGIGVVGLNSKNYGGFKQLTAAGKFLISQWIENIDSIPRLSRTVTFQVKMKATSSKTIRIALVELQAAGTADSIPATLVSAWGVNLTDPTLATNVATIGTVVSCAVTTNFAIFSCSVTIPSNSKNIGVALWTDSQFSINDELHIAEACLYNGSVAATPYWYPRPTQQELALCQRYYEKAYDYNTAPSSTTNGLEVMAIYSANPAAGSPYGSVTMRVEKRTNPTVTIYPYTTPANTGRVSDDLGTDQVANSGFTGDLGNRSFKVYNQSGSALALIHPAVMFGWTAEADM